MKGDSIEIEERLDKRVNCEMWAAMLGRTEELQHTNCDRICGIKWSIGNQALSKQCTGNIEITGEMAYFEIRCVFCQEFVKSRIGR